MNGFLLDMMGTGLPAATALAVSAPSLLSQTALGSTQLTAFVVTTACMEFTTVAASTGAILPGSGGRVSNGDVIFIVNNGANALSVYPPVGKSIGLVAANTAVSVATGKSALFQARGDGNYFAILSA